MVATYLASFAAALLLSLVLTRCIRDTAMRRGWVAAPSSHHIHRRPMPRLGGVAIFISFVTVTSLLTATSHEVWPGFAPRTLAWLLIPGAMVFLLGLYDDIYSARPSLKFAVQALAASLLFFGGVGRFNLPAILGLPGLEWLALPLTILWVLWITNAFNLIDGLDGLAAGSTLFSTLTLFAVSCISGNQGVTLLALTLAGAIIGFLRFNFNPASIFLGDCGSMFLGFTLSALALTGSQKTPTTIAVAIPVVSFGLPILETALSVVRRYLSGQPLFTADRDHIHHKLMKRGLTHRQVVILLYGVSALCGLLSLCLLYPGGVTMAIVLLVLSVCIWSGLRHLGYHEFHELGRTAHRAVEQKQVISNNVAIHRATERLADAKDFLHLCWILQDAFEANDFDGYYLRFATAPVKPHIGSELWFPTPEHIDEQRFAWHRPTEGELTEELLLHSWTLTLELVTARKQRSGFFTLYRTHNDRPSIVDLNLLTSSFQVALADTVDRLMCQARQSSEEASQLSVSNPKIASIPAANELSTDWTVYRPENMVEGRRDALHALKPV
jgi:UDP-GlcNAc:undecaprenyl-phosphate GlcNAc-1-phosphate transferase